MSGLSGGGLVVTNYLGLVSWPLTPASARSGSVSIEYMRVAYFWTLVSKEWPDFESTLESSVSQTDARLGVLGKILPVPVRVVPS